jgi:hypothetical protein
MLSSMLPPLARNQTTCGWSQIGLPADSELFPRCKPSVSPEIGANIQITCLKEKKYGISTIGDPQTHTIR